MVSMQMNHRNATLLLVGEKNDFVRQIKHDLLENGFMVREVIPVNHDDLSETLRVDAVVVCSCLQESLDGISYVERVREFCRETPLFFVAQHGSEKKAVAALRSGVTDYYSGSLPTGELVRAVRHHLHDRSAAFGLPEQSRQSMENGGPDLVGISTEIKEARNYLLKVAAMDSTVLITGETGTGKELAADFIHWHSKRRKRPFVRVNSSAMPEQLVESELFGYEKGAFTDAHSAKPGKFEQADTGTLFLDEIGEMATLAQSKILRILENKRVHRLGGHDATSIDVRIIAATNQHLEDQVAKGLFRKDLFFRLNVARVHLPPLRERREDIPLLLNKFMQEFNESFDLQVTGFSEKAWFCLLKYDWPGNIRELKNVLEATYINVPSSTITFRDLPKPYQTKFYGGDFRPKSERDQVLSALFATNWNKSRAAQELNWSRMTLYRKMAKHQIVQNRSIRTRFADLPCDS